MSEGSVTKIGLHCSFEHLEGTSDIGFIREAARLLKPGGKVVIVPLYLAWRYSALTDPLVLHTNRVLFERDMLVVARRGWGNRHGRFYDPAHLSQRVLHASEHLAFTLYRLANPADIAPSIYARFVLVGTKTG